MDMSLAMTVVIAASLPKVGHRPTSRPRVLVSCDPWSSTTVLEDR